MSRVEWVDAIDSTNTGMRARAEQGAPHGSALAARRQSAGRGRLGRVWDGGQGNLALSVLLREGLDPARLALLTLGAGVVLADAVRALGGHGFGLKWPNDLLDAEGRKVAGILAEAEWSGGRLAFVVVGVGVNVRSAPDGAGSLAASGIDVSAEDLADRLVEGLVGLDLDGVVARWTGAQVTLGRPVQVGEVRGLAVGLAPDGALRVQTSAGEQRVISGDLGFVG